MIQFLHDHNYEWDHPIITKHKQKGVDVSVLNASNQHQIKSTALYLHRLIVPEGCRGLGLGTGFMTEFCKFLDENELPVGTVIRAVQGQDQNKLVDFLQKFNFMHISNPQVNIYWNIINGDYIRLPQ